MMNFSSKKLQMMAWLFFSAFIIIYLINADRVHQALCGYSQVVKLPDTFSLHARGELQLAWSSDYLPMNNKFKEGKGFSAVFESVANTSGTAKARVFFRSSDALYEMIGTRKSQYAVAQKVTVNLFAPTSRLANGIYQMGLYFSDDAGEAFEWRNSFFEKVAGGSVEYIARPVPLVVTRACKDLRFACEGFDKRDKLCVLQGWVVLENAEMDDYNAYITIQDSQNVVKAFYAPLFTRMDIASLYADIRAANSGFQLKIPRSDVAPGKLVIKAVIKSRKTGEAIESVQAVGKNF